MSERQLRRARGRRARVIVAAGGTLTATALAAAPAQAGTFTVTTLDDDDEVDGTLREEIEDANASAGADTITFESGLSGSIVLENGEIDITDPLTIQGPGPDVITVDGSDLSRLLYANNAETLDISGLRLEDGFVIPLAPNDGAGLRSTGTDVTVHDTIWRSHTAGGPQSYGGAIFIADGSEGDLEIVDSQFTGNVAGFGGGAVMAGTEDYDTTITNSTFTANVAATRVGGALYLGGTSATVTGSEFIGNYAGRAGGALYSYGAVTIAGSDFDLNAAGAYYGGSVHNDGGTLAIDRTTITGSVAGTQGGGVFVNQTDTDDEVQGQPEVAITNSTIADNRAVEGAGVHLDQPEGDVLISNSTISGNSAEEGGGVSLAAGGAGVDFVTTVQNSTITANSASARGGGIYDYGGDDDGDGEGDPVALSSTIVAGNSAPNGPDLAGGGSGDPTTFAVRFSLIRNATPGGDATTIEAQPGTNLFGIDPQLGPLQSNGGPTHTRLPAPTSPVIDRGIANALGTDQRGLVRPGDVGAIPNAPGGDGTDIGSVELQVADCRGSGALRFDGTEADDDVSGTDASDAISLLGGNDSADARGGDDCVGGGAGRDRLTGAGGKDRVNGDTGRDNLKGGGGKDRVSGGGGKDKLSGQGGKDTLKGGGGKDRLKGGPGKDKLTGGGGKDRFNCGGGKDKVTAQAKDKVSASCEKVVEKG